ncbi:PP2C family protein-serine/threonine phosphatase [Actinoplanes sp. NPDC026623]|uniref:PP2C family protein-serine/threonine phosphatase n=1 Tax=Actinoplanes sp. NPDC026623 TaxID=3155610 RepID=UPI0033D333B6
MTGKPEGMWLDVISEVLERSHLFQPDELATVLDAEMGRLGCRTRIFLADAEQRALRMIPQHGVPTVEPFTVDDSLPGEVFRLVRMRPATDDEDPALWVPMVNGTDRIGVIEFHFAGSVDVADEALRRRCATVAGLMGHLITVTEPKGDLLFLLRRERPMSAGAELLEQLLPPLTVSCERLVLSAVLEPRYDIGGDGFDYAFDGPMVRMSIFDGVGRGLRAGLAFTVAVVAIRAARRAGLDLYGQARAADAALLEQFSDARFVTAILAELNMDTGLLRYVNAGHPPPVLLRGGKAVPELRGGRRLPLGLDDARFQPGEETLEPGDRLLFYTDGVIEARDAAGEMFGVDRLVEQAERHAAEDLPAPETVRRLARAVANFYDGPARDDTTLVLADWSASASRRTIP